jgi:hypothetical protein
MDLLIKAENIEQVCLRLSTIDKTYVWLEERRQEIVRKWWRKEIIPFKPAGFYYNGNYGSPIESYSTSNLIIDTENKKIKRKAELFIKYKNSDYRNLYFNSDEDARKTFNEIKSKTNLFHINFVSE